MKKDETLTELQKYMSMYKIARRIKVSDHTMHMWNRRGVMPNEENKKKLKELLKEVKNSHA